MKKLITSVLITIALQFPFTLSAQNVNIPDANFKALLLANSTINTNADGNISYSEAAAYTGSINANSSGISNMTGIEAFTSLTSLNCGFNNISSLDLTYNVSLTTVSCVSNSIATLNVYGLTSLTSLDCNINNLTCLDLSTNINLAHLNCNTNNLSSLNLLNGHNSTLTSAVMTSNSMLYCIQVDNVANANAAGWSHDTWSSYSTSCGSAPVAGFTYSPACSGSPVLFTDQSTFASTWHWDFGDGNTSTIVNPSHIYANPGSYPVKLIARNCLHADTVIHAVSQGADVIGHVDYSGGNVTSGYAIIYPFQPFYTSFDTTQIQLLDASGNFHFTNIPNADYLIKVLPDTVAFPTLMPTYYGGDWAWDSSSVLTHDCINDDFINITILEGPGTSGIGMLHGTIVEGPGFGRSQGDPVHGVDVKLGITGGQIVARTTSDNNGQYTFGNIALGNYTIYADIPGLERDSCYTLVVDASNNQFMNLDYMVDSVSIYISPTAGIENNTSTDMGLLKVYPNPARENTLIEYSVTTGANVQLAIYSMYGIKVQSLVNADVPSGQYNYSFSPKAAQLKPGVYFVSLTVNGKTRTTRLVVME